MSEVSALKLALMARQVRARSAQALLADPIAVVGMGCRLPGGADTPDRFWLLLLEGVETVREVPPDRWNVAPWYDPDLATPGKSATKAGSFLDRIDAFDAGYFGIPPREAERMDPQQRLLLEVASEALEDAGLTQPQLAGSRTGVFIASYHNDYAQLQYADVEAIDLRTLTGTLHSVLANRLSHFLDLHGPSVSIDTACSASLVAVHLACQSLRMGESDIAITGGVSLIIAPELQVAMSKVGFMAADGRCKTFDAQADGFGRGEGCSVVVLKRLSDAVADGDRVLAVIRGSAVNQDGRSTVLAAPNGRAQEALIREALANAQLGPERIGFVETHGTGTALGDPIEVEAIAATIGRAQAGAGPCLLGSAKANLGHLEAAAGATGLIKAILALRNAVVPPQPNFLKLNPHISLAGTRLAIATVPTPWVKAETPRCAAVSSFGVGGTNAHVIVEEAPDLPSPAVKATADDAWLLPLSAKTPTALQAMATDWMSFLSATPATVADICHTASLRRTHRDGRLAVVGRSKAELRDALADHVTIVAAATGGRQPIAFVFSGQGPQWDAMGRELLAAEPVFRDTLAECDELLQPLAGWSLMEELSRPAKYSRLDQTEIAQPALFSIQVALAALWRSWGIVPDAVVGHSVGEIAALHVAGVLTRLEAIRVVFHRGRIMQGATGHGRMAAVALSEADATAWLSGYDGRLSIGAINSPTSAVLSGDGDALEEVLAGLASRGGTHRLLPVQYAFHSAQMAPFQQPFMDALGAVSASAPKIAFFSTVCGGAAPDTVFDASYFSRNMRERVRFADAIEAMRQAGYELFLEVSPHPVLAHSIAECFAARGTEPTVLASLRRGRPERETMLRSCAALYAAGHDLDWQRVQPTNGQTISLPPYPWQRSRHWIRSRPAAVMQPDTGAERHPLLGCKLALAGIGEQVFAGGSRGGPPWLLDHRVFGRLLLPAAAMADMLLAAIGKATGWPQPMLSDLGVQRPLVLPEGDAADTRWQVVVKPSNGCRMDATLYQAQQETGSPDASWLAVASAIGEPGPANHQEQPFAPLSGGHSIDPDDIYAEFGRLGVDFGPSFRCLESVRIGADVAEAWVTLPTEQEETDFGAVHPLLLDAAFQLCSVASRYGRESDFLSLPVGADRIAMRPGGHRHLLVRVRLRNSEAPTVTIADIAIETPSGEQVASVSGMRFARADRGALATEGSRSDVYTVAWVPAPKMQQPSPAEVRGTWLVFADAGGTGDALAEAIRASGGDCHVVHAGAAFSRTSEWSWSVNPTDPAQFCRLFLAPEIADGLADGVVVHAWSLDVAPGAPTELMAHDDALAIGSVLHLTQCLADLAIDPTPRLCLLTHGAQAVDEQGVTQPRAAGLWGIAGVAAIEHPELRLRLIDLDPSQDGVAPEQLLSELTTGREPRVALRGGGRLAARLRRSNEDIGHTSVRPHNEPLRLTLVQPGSIDGLQLQPCPPASLGPNEVRLRVLAAGLNFRDVLGTLEMVPGDPPPLGVECAGVVLEAGRDVDRFRAGDRVFGFAPASCATDVVVPAAFLAPMLPGMRAEDAAGIAVPFLTAQYGLHDLARLQTGERVLIHAAAGGVGLAAVQLAQHCGAEVFATAGSAEKRAFLRRLGVSHVMDSRSAAFADGVLAATCGRGVHIVMNSLADEFIPAGLRALAPGGCFLELGKRGIWSAEQVAAMRPDVRYHVYDLGALAQADHGLLPSLYSAILPALSDGSLRPLPRTTFPLARFGDAFRHMALARHIGKVVLRVSADDAAGPPVSPTATYWITGGLGALGMATADWLVQGGARHLVLTGRHPPDAEARLSIEALEDRGATIRVFACDAAERDGMAGVLDVIATTMPPLRGVIHAAGALSDAVLVNQRWPEGWDPLRGKAHGAWILHELTRTLPLDFFVLYSAAGVVLGAPGQGLYAAANAELDALARYRRRLGLPALSVAWGAWSGGGMAATLANSGNRIWQTRGLRWITPSDGFAALAKLIAEDVAYGAVVPIDWSRFLGQLPAGADRDLFAEVAPPASPPKQEGPAAEPASLAARMRALPAGLRRQSLTTELRERVLHLLALDKATPVDARTPLKQLGLDSLTAVELRNVLVRSGGVPLPATVLFDHPTLEALASHLIRVWQLDADAEPHCKSIADMSDAEAEALLAEELAIGAAGGRP
jgi:acyl transferase domain-containing protein